MQTKWFKPVIVIVVIALLALTAIAVSAQDNRPGMPGWGHSGSSLITSAAEVLDITESDLIAELKAGKTIAEVAQAKGVALDKIVDAFVATRAARLTELVTAKRLTQEQADAMLTTMKAHVTLHLSQPYEELGFGMGQGMMGGRGHGMMGGRGQGMMGGRGHGMMGGHDMDENCPFAETTPQSS